MFKKLMTAAAIAASTLALTATANAAEVFALQSVHSGKYVSAGGDGYLAATQPSAKTALKFDMVRVQANQVAFRDTRSGKYLRAGVSRGALLAVTSNRVAGWETFHMRANGGNLTLRSAQNGKYVRAGVGRGSKLAAVSDRADAWETFRLVRIHTSSAARAPQQRQPQAGGFELGGTWRLGILRDNQGRLSHLDNAASGATRVVISSRGNVSGTGGCNSFDTRVQQPSRAAVRFDRVTSTKRRCGGSADTYERGMFNAFAASRYFARQNGSLFLYDGNGQEIARFYGG
ncbi:META domain-containing protein [Tepidamorphus sp. 3E244]|uniref:META domain-containing protein n=1 Tax=Tepidamorphus sp. 3E244 TaxID=3385498 RepID=UPI0038FC00E8